MSIDIEANARDYQRAWMKWRSVWTTVYYAAGILAAGLATATEAYTKADADKAMGLAIASAIVGFVATIADAGKRGRAFERAGRKMERAFADYDGANIQVLRDGIKAGLDELDASGA